MLKVMKKKLNIHYLNLHIKNCNTILIYKIGQMTLNKSKMAKCLECKTI